MVGEFMEWVTFHRLANLRILTGFLKSDIISDTFPPYSLILPKSLEISLKLVHYCNSRYAIFKMIPWPISLHSLWKYIDYFGFAWF